MGSIFDPPSPKVRFRRPPDPAREDPRMVALRRRQREALMQPKRRGATILTGLLDSLDSLDGRVQRPDANRTASAAPRQATILTAGLEPRADGPAHPPPDQPKPQPQPKPEQPKPEQPKPEQPKPEQPKPDKPEKPEENPCQAIEDTLNSILDDIFVKRGEIRAKEDEIATKKEEIRQLKSERIDLPPLPGRLPRRPFRLREQIPGTAKDIVEMHRAQSFLNKRERIRAVEKELADLKKELEKLHKEEKMFKGSRDQARGRLRECEAGNG